MRSLLLASSILTLVVVGGCAKSEDPAATAPTTPAPVSAGTGKKGMDLGSSDATPLMSNADAEARAGSALGNK